MPLPISVKTPQDLAFKSEAERQYLIFNLMAGGRLAYEAGDYAPGRARVGDAAQGPESAVRVSRVVTPLAGTRAASGGVAADGARPRAAATRRPTTTRPAARARRGHPPTRPPATPAGTTAVAGTVVGGGSIGPGAAVHLARALDGPTPRRTPATQPRVVDQAGKAFIPHVLAIGIGETRLISETATPSSTTSSRSAPGSTFDAGLYDGGHSYLREAFTSPGRSSSCVTSTRRCSAISTSSTPRTTRSRARTAPSRSATCPSGPLSAERLARIVGRRHPAGRHRRPRRRPRPRGPHPRRSRAAGRRSRQVR